MPRFITINLSKQKIKLFKKLRFPEQPRIKGSRLMFSVLLLAALIALTVVVTKPQLVTVFLQTASASGAKRKLPIYSVDTNEKKVALTFDAAWGAA